MASPRVAQVRQFNRFYTRQIGLLDEGLVGSPWSLTEVRVLYELAHRDRPAAAAIAADLGLDKGYLSRMLRRFAGAGLVRRHDAPADGRRALLSLTPKGRRTFRDLDQRTNRQVARLLSPLTERRQRELLAGMRTIESLLAPAPGERARAWTLRDPEPGDMGWIAHRNGALYFAEYGWDWTFEALVARICAEFVEHFDPAAERCWVADLEGEVVGSIFCVRQSARVAKLRVLYVEPAVRGLGIGARLVHECLRFAKDAGYHRMTLWTNDVLHAARRIYQAEGFRLVREEKHHSFGHDLVGQNWDLDLRAWPPNGT